MNRKDSASAQCLSVAPFDEAYVVQIIPARLRHAALALLPRLHGPHGTGSSLFGFHYTGDYITIRSRDGGPDYLLHHDAVNSINFGDAEKLNLTPGEAEVLIRLGTLSRDGYVRERYLHEAMVQGDPEMMPYVIIRLADWVPVISRLVDDLLLTHAEALEPALMAANIGLIDFVETRKPKAKSIGLLLQQAVGDPGDAFGSLPEKRRRQVAYAWLGAPELNRRRLAAIISDPAPGVRLTVVLHWRSDFGADVAKRIARDKSRLVRKIFYHLQLRGDIPRFRDLDPLVLRD